MSIFISQQSIQAETSYRQERIKRDFRAFARKQRTAPGQHHAAPRHARRSLRPNTAA
ncbi:hypothetical protein Kfla_6255 [Kribbella flavida DSM 17836]|uniref:Uncharacterized protein n=1 Tax=Kribbella flavida (strain DSM 17836 / JCM 10339 / NBRC 14399) TaxID=479435 RepID=D2PVL8_KRIFD|nr:hypothetical protein [Kribbella flavida]ADB35258.1 hypothetical protein Kfla_6255 [Kribbella flavida DSM 17836]